MRKMLEVRKTVMASAELQCPSFLLFSLDLFDLIFFSPSSAQTLMLTFHLVVVFLISVHFFFFFLRGFSLKSFDWFPFLGCRGAY